MTYQKGFSTDLHGGLQITGSNCRTGVSGISFRGVYRAPIGTTKREASYKCSVNVARSIGASTDHSRARKYIPTESQAISVFNLAPLLLQSLDVHFYISTGRFHDCGYLAGRAVLGGGGYRSLRGKLGVLEDLSLKASESLYVREFSI